MPLLDHFHGRLSEERSWETFHAAWAGSLSDDLNRRLPEGYFAEEHTHAGAGVEIDLATWEGQSNGEAPGTSRVAVAEPAVYSPPAPARTIPAVFSDDFEIKVFTTKTGPRLVAAIELISPRNKDRAEARQAFAVKCASYLHQGVSLIVVDIVTERHANLHEQILKLLPASGGSMLPEGRCSTRWRTGRCGARGRSRSTCGRAGWRWASRCRHCRWRCRARCAWRSTWRRRTWTRGGAGGCDPA